MYLLFFEPANRISIKLLLRRTLQRLVIYGTAAFSIKLHHHFLNYFAAIKHKLKQ
jgi:hypothetical protein